MYFSKLDVIFRNWCFSNHLALVTTKVLVKYWTSTIEIPQFIHFLEISLVDITRNSDYNNLLEIYDLTRDLEFVSRIMITNIRLSFISYKDCKEENKFRTLETGYCYHEMIRGAILSEGFPVTFTAMECNPVTFSTKQQIILNLLHQNTFHNALFIRGGNNLQLLESLISFYSKLENQAIFFCLIFHIALMKKSFSVYNFTGKMIFHSKL